MNQPAHRRPSPALIVAILALVVAMAGTAFAATQLPKNSVASKQIKKNAVTAAKIKKNAITTAKVKKEAITSAKIKLSTLKTVPSAQTANTIVAPEATHLVGTSGQPGFLSGSTNYPEGVGGARLAPVGFFKDHEGIVHLQGVAKGGTGVVPNIAPVFQLPPGYRPASGTLLLFAGGTGAAALIAGGATSLLGVNVEGNVLGEEGEAIPLDGISFRAES